MASVYDGESKKKFDKLQKNAQNVSEKPFEKGRFLRRGSVLERIKTQNLKGIFCGASVGAANSLFGGGGGMLAVPLLQKSGYDEKTAHATAILVILPVSVFSFLLYFFRGLYDFSVLIPTAIGVAAGGFLGAAWLGKLPVKTVNIVFAVLQAFAGAFLFFS